MPRTPTDKVTRKAATAPAGTAATTPSVVVSEELFAPVSAEIELCYQTFGDPDDDPLLLVMGLGGPMTWWEPALCTRLAEAGFYVVRFDNRDAGRSSRGSGKVTRSMLVRGFTGVRTRPPYTLADMAADAFGLLDHFGLDSAHVAGVSMVITTARNSSRWYHASTILSWYMVGSPSSRNCTKSRSPTITVLSN